MQGCHQWRRWRSARLRRSLARMANTAMWVGWVTIRLPGLPGFTSEQTGLASRAGSWWAGDAVGLPVKLDVDCRPGGNRIVRAVGRTDCSETSGTGGLGIRQHRGVWFRGSKLSGHGAVQGTLVRAWGGGATSAAYPRMVVPSFGGGYGERGVGASWAFRTGHFSVAPSTGIDSQRRGVDRVRPPNSGYQWNALGDSVNVTDRRAHDLGLFF